MVISEEERLIAVEAGCVGREEQYDKESSVGRRGSILAVAGKSRLVGSGGL